MTWADSFLHTLKDNDVRLVTYVRDNVLTPLIAGARPTTISCRWGRRANAAETRPLLPRFEVLASDLG